MFRRLTKTVPKQCSVYFTIDDTTAVMPTKKITMVEGARPITKGEKVMVTWNGQGLEAYILELSGKYKQITLYTFLYLYIFGPNWQKTKHVC